MKIIPKLIERNPPTKSGKGLMLILFLISLTLTVFGGTNLYRIGLDGGFKTLLFNLLFFLIGSNMLVTGFGTNSSDPLKTYGMITFLNKRMNLYTTDGLYFLPRLWRVGFNQIHFEFKIEKVDVPLIITTQEGFLSKGNAAISIRINLARINDFLDRGGWQGIVSFVKTISEPAGQRLTSGREQIFLEKNKSEISSKLRSGLNGIDGADNPDDDLRDSGVEAMDVQFTVSPPEEIANARLEPEKMRQRLQTVELQDETVLRMAIKNMQAARQNGDNETVFDDFVKAARRNMNLSLGLSTSTEVTGTGSTKPIVVTEAGGKNKT